MSKQLLTIQVARGLAANLVALAHLQVMDQKYAGGDLPGSLMYGIAGVDVFFVLSGFIMVAIAGRQTRADEFLARRVVRIYPMYWIISGIVLAVSLALPGSINAAAGGEYSIWKSFLLLPQPGLPLLAVGWTLVHEMYFYLVFALMLFLRVPVPVGIAGWLACMGVGYLVTPSHVLAASPLLRLALSPLTVEFMLGAAVGFAYLHTPMRAARPAVAVAIAALLCTLDFGAEAKPIVTYPNLEAWRVLLFGVPAALIIYALAAWEKRGAPRPPALLVSLGDWSYATYLVHVLVLSAFGRAIAVALPPGVLATMLFLLVGLAAANLAGAAMTRWIERPLLDGAARRRRRRAAVRAGESEGELMLPAHT